MGLEPEKAKNTGAAWSSMSQGQERDKRMH